MNLPLRRRNFAEEDDYQDEQPQQNMMMQPVPPTLSQEHLEYLDGIDEIPESLRVRFWGLFTRHNQFTHLPNEFEIHRARVFIRATMRPMVWRGEITFDEYMMVQRFVELQIQKSRGQSERRLLAPWLQEMIQIQRNDSSSDNKRGLGPGAFAALFRR